MTIFVTIPAGSREVSSGCYSFQSLSLCVGKCYITGQTIAFLVHFIYVLIGAFVNPFTLHVFSSVLPHYRSVAIDRKRHLDTTRSLH
jgi:hypothetical protein